MVAYVYAYIKPNAANAPLCGLTYHVVSVKAEAPKEPSSRTNGVCRTLRGAEYKQAMEALQAMELKKGLNPVEPKERWT